MLTTSLIDQILMAIPHCTVGLVGDLFLDRYLDIDPVRDEPSIETGLTAYQVTRVRSYPGALGTVVNNLAALGVGRILPIAAIGDDGEGYELRQALARLPGVDLHGLVIAPDRRTPTYTKPMYGPRELNRLDIKNRTPMPSEYENAILERLDAAWSQCDALLVLDQVTEENCGVVTTRVRDWLAERAGADPQKFVLADSRVRIGLFRNVCAKPNQSELTAIPAGIATLFVTRGEQGIELRRREADGNGWQVQMIAGYPVAGPVDIVGAGDSCSAGIACGMMAGLTHERAAAFGNLVASITVQQLGTTGTASPDQVRERWREVNR